ncbi:hypothetical protein FGIG_02551 [Fasciola gigantica]|uniref:Uncharacterized protein n=1 Tax=Fasciola gigantica TaxID=46835 RepID=A0A504YLT1_FASGI|nr:hypothetical protein FGIG_02551 [Fasciola gigantica]
MLTVVEFVGENTVAVVNDLWMVGSDHAMWPSVGASRAERLVRDGHPPPVNSKAYKVKAHIAVASYSCGSMLTVVEFVGENTVAVVNDLWMVGSDHAMWPSVGASRAERLVRDGHPPPVNSKAYKVKAHIAVGKRT